MNLEQSHRSPSDDIDQDDGNDSSFEMEENESDGEASSGEKDLRDATIKLVRLLANLTIDPTIGAQATGRKSVLEVCYYCDAYID